jgi:cytochrome c-type biogenesis protein CcmH/NrfG
MNKRYPIFFTVLISLTFSFCIHAEETPCDKFMSTTTTNTQKNNDPDIAKNTAEKEEVEAQILRIRKLLETEPKAKGWVIIGDASMSLEKYNDAVLAYQEAYILDGSPEIRKKLKRAIYLDNH